MSKTLRIGLTEFLNSLRSKAFIIGALAVPIIYAVAFLVMNFASKQKDTRDKHFAVIDETGRLYAAVERAAAKRGDQMPRFLPERVEPDTDELALRLRLSDRIRTEELFAFIVIESGVIAGEPVEGLRYYTATPTSEALPNWLRKTVNTEIVRIRFDEAKLDRRQVEELIDEPQFSNMELVEADADGSIIGGGQENPILYTAVPIIMVMMLFMMVMTSAPALLTTALEEKTNKVSEFLISAVSPFQLMMGKLLGAIGTSMALAVIYLGAASGFAAHYGVLAQIPASLFLWFFFFLALSVMIYGSACIAIGSVCSEIRDAQGLMMPVTLLMVLPLMLLQPVLQAPGGSFARAVTFFPAATPILLVLRNAVPPGLPWWELALGVVVCVAFMTFSVWAAAKIFRIGILAQGQTPTIPKLIRWVFSK